ncbi:stressosome-associated protein Prli42 [Salinibacillus xinjiangensis]|uniref:Stressosome-associated protein Prli42 n=1 Tax=Salinibacillus xinjiangensis TaxID=1229268 RepID=A0A6G1X6K2_9BACI|nr:stressosome-associated protein Prli42 [Salinibacillus xinjiangensis]MRG86510.1 stressosome-associated protein Prli42 [Salinibacillus xinjiangensis]
MAKKKKNTAVQNKPKKSKREKRMKIIIYLMVLAMILSSLLAGAGMFLY